MFKVVLDDDLASEFETFCKNPANKQTAKAVLKALGYMHENIRHPSLTQIR